MGVCPQKVIKMRIDPREGLYIPTFKRLRECVNCQLCIKVCPGRVLDLESLNLFAFNKIPEDSEIGNYICCYIGHSTDMKIRWAASSGGLVTSILCFALENGLIDGAIVTRMSRSDPLKPQIILARKKEDILSSMGSKYCPVPVNAKMSNIKEEKFAIVGLPCHIHGVRKVEMLRSDFRDKVVLRLGLFCSRGVNFLGTRFLLDRLGVQKEEILQINYRGSGWPGSLSVRLKNGKEIFYSYSRYMTFLYAPFLFTPTRCMMCSDTTNVLADISFGDAWLPELKKSERIGMSIVVSRTPKGEYILQKMVSQGLIKLWRIDSKKVIESQQVALRFKRHASARIWALKRLRRSTSVLSLRLANSSITTRIYAMLQSILFISSRNDQFRSAFKFAPHQLLRICSLILEAIDFLLSK